MNKENVKKKIEKIVEQFTEQFDKIIESKPVITEDLKERPARPDAVESKLTAEYKARLVAEAQSQSSSLSSEKSTKR